MDIKALSESIIDRLRASVSMKDVYGEPMEIGGKTIVPIANIAFGYGAGGGEGRSKKQEEGEPNEGSGMGGGGWARAKPVAILEISEGRTRIIPVIEFTKVAMMAIAGAIVIAIITRRR
jgi:uncharacterized spore protein YtfJ